PAGGSSTRQQLATPTQKHLIARTHHHHNPSAMNFRRALGLTGRKLPKWLMIKASQNSSILAVSR
ncbi:MAG: hypothetical protein ABSG78_18955, partial [Verrucomicrobiota bacterium]